MKYYKSYYHRGIVTAAKRCNELNEESGMKWVVRQTKKPGRYEVLRQTEFEQKYSDPSKVDIAE